MFLAIDPVCGCDKNVRMFYNLILDMSKTN